MKALPALVDEYAACDLPDPRLLDRLVTIASALEANPAASFPKAFQDRSQLEALYRFLGNDRFDLPELLYGHFEKTLERCQQYEVCLAVHDTTDFTFTGERTDLGIVDRAQQGFYGHFCLAVAPGEHREPLGLLAADTWLRHKKKGKRTTEARKKEQDLESARWLRQSQQVETLAHGLVSLIHVEDREGDIFESLATRLDEGHRFIVRGHSYRLVLADGVAENVREHARSLPRQLTRTVKLSRRKPKGRVPKQGPARRQREAVLEIAASTVHLRRPQRDRSGPETIPISLVHVIETGDVPEGEDRVEWLLYSSEPIETPEQIEFIVDGYRSRWLIEEYFKALKTGCNYEKRQLESGDALRRALGLFAVQAWRLLALRFVERASNDDLPAEMIATQAEIEVLQAKKLISKKHPAAREVLKAIAKMGGHLSNNGPPGFLVLWRGLCDLQALAQGWALARSCDQS